MARKKSFFKKIGSKLSQVVPIAKKVGSVIGHGAIDYGIPAVGAAIGGVAGGAATENPLGAALGATGGRAAGQTISREINRKARF
jgi:hypothetical protein